ncbi:CHAP domain-containing protein [Novispirillum sp. DQ9]|uniref:CHAP domain-containing protein n=1 Tax=Novispirillum sp. DQ9 TaxID=3398612 RepID=UPI003C7ED106
MMSAPDAQALPKSGYWSCVPYARSISSIDLSGDAWRWWDAAAGVYGRGQAPREGSVLVFKRTSQLRQGHVAVVRQVIDNRRILVDHANWDRGRRKGRIDSAVGILDVSPKNDWTQVRVWYTPVGDYGTTRYPTNGFIYPQGAGRAAGVHQAVQRTVQQPLQQAVRQPLPLSKPQVMTPIPVSLPKPQQADVRR